MDKVNIQKYSEIYVNSPHLRCDSTVGVKSVPRPQVPPIVGARDFADEDEGEVPFGNDDEDEGEVDFGANDEDEFEVDFGYDDNEDEEEMNFNDGANEPEPMEVEE